jgi:Zn-dependent M28 family amino/carboxypeptidase
MLHADLVSRIFEDMGFDPMTYKGEYKPQEMNDVELGLSVDAEKEMTRCHNVVGIIPGSVPELSTEYLTVGAHLDHLGRDGDIIYYGANDNASSCVLILEAARALAENPLKRPVLFILFTAEEIGHYGSLHYVAHPAVPHDRVFLNINLEQIGARTRNFDGIWAIGPASETKTLSAVRKKAPKIGFGFDSIDTQVSTISGSDTLSFYLARLPAIILGSGGFPEHHRTSDNVDLIDYEHLSRATALVKAYIEELGNRTEEYFE